MNEAELDRKGQGISFFWRVNDIVRSTKTKDSWQAEMIASEMFKELKDNVDKAIETSKVRTISSLLDEFYNFKWKSAVEGEQSLG